MIWKQCNLIVFCSLNRKENEKGACITDVIGTSYYIVHLTWSHGNSILQYRKVLNGEKRPRCKITSVFFILFIVNVNQQIADPISHHQPMFLIQMYLHLPGNVFPQQAAHPYRNLLNLRLFFPFHCLRK